MQESHQNQEGVLLNEQPTGSGWATNKNSSINIKRMVSPQIQVQSKYLRSNNQIQEHVAQSNYLFGKVLPSGSMSPKMLGSLKP